MPYDSLYQATKSSIQQGIFEMQERLRHKNQLQLERELTDQVVQQQRRYRQERQLAELQRVHNENSKYNNALMQKTTHDPYVNSVLYESGINYPAQMGYSELRQAIRRETEHLEYLKRLERMKDQSTALNVPFTDGYAGLQYEDSLFKQLSHIREVQSNKLSALHSRGDTSRKSPPKFDKIYNNLQYDQTLQQDSSALLQKYNKGIRAQQYNREMQRLMEIEKRMRRVQQASAAKSSYRPGNQSVVTPYQPRYIENRQFDRIKQDIPFVSAKQTIREAQRTFINDLKSASRYRNQPSHYKNQPSMQENKKIDMFQNEKIGEVINRRPQQKQQLRTTIDVERSPGMDQHDRYVKNPHTRNSILKPVSFGRPSTVKPQKSTKRQVSRSNISALSPLKSERSHNKRSTYQPYIKEKRLRSKSTKTRYSNSRLDASHPSRKVGYSMISLDPMTEKMVEDILRKQINEKIQARMQLLNCVFKDVKMRQQRNEIDNLQQRFDVQMRARKEVKSMINNDPKILKKHKLVVK